MIIANRYLAMIVSLKKLDKFYNYDYILSRTQAGTQSTEVLHQQ